MQVTSRDIEVLRWINSNGVVTIEHIVTEYKISQKVAYRRMRQLSLQGLVLHHRYYYNQPGIYRVSRSGVALSEDSLPALRRIPATTLKHDLLVTTVSQQLRHHYNAAFITERQLRQKMGKHGVGQREHVSDGHLMIADKTTAIEVELSLKGRRRRESIAHRYMANLDIEAVWYFCRSGPVYRKMKVLEEDNSLIKIFDIAVYLNQNDNACVAR